MWNLGAMTRPIDILFFGEMLFSHSIEKILNGEKSLAAGKSKFPYRLLTSNFCREISYKEVTYAR
jgi:hypothetical protein